MAGRSTGVCFLGKCLRPRQPSHTLAAMGKDPLAIDTAIRVSFCGDNTPEDVDAFPQPLEDGMKHLQKIRK